MSTNTMGGARPRNEGDCYYTPQPLADAICRRLREVIGEVDYALEPSVGGGSFVAPARMAWPAAHIAAADADARLRRSDHPALRAADSFSPGCRWEDCDLTNETPWRVAQRHLIVGNPPFLLAGSHVRIALDRLGHATATEPQP